MSIIHEPTIQALAQYAYEPLLVYLGCIGMMLLSSFGFPLPEEVTIISLGLISYIGHNPDLFPPPSPDAVPVNMWVSAIVCFLAILMSDSLVFTLGRTVGRKMMYWPFMRTVLTNKVSDKVDRWIHKYGIMAVLLFRFTPGIRFPAHLFIGFSKLPMWQFLLIDGIAALISVPTQILIVAHYGEVILSTIQKFKMYVLMLAGLFLIIMIARKLNTWLENRRAPQASTEPLNSSKCK